MRARGQVVCVGPDGASYEAASFTCAHCNRIVIVRKDTQFGGCRMCMKNVCSGCESRGTCDPFEKQLERMERRARLLEAMNG